MYVIATNVGGTYISLIGHTLHIKFRMYAYVWIYVCIHTNTAKKTVNLGNFMNA